MYSHHIFRHIFSFFSFVFKYSPAFQSGLVIFTWNKIILELTWKLNLRPIRLIQFLQVEIYLTGFLMHTLKFYQIMYGLNMTFLCLIICVFYSFILKPLLSHNHSVACNLLCRRQKQPPNKGEGSRKNKTKQQNC